MKTSQFFTTSLIALIAAPMILVGCDKPKQRTEVVNKKIESNLVAIKNLHDVTSDTSKAYFYKENINEAIKKIDDAEQIQIDVEISKVLHLIEDQNKINVMNDSLKTGVIAFVILPDQLKIYKVVQKEDLKTESNASMALTFSDIQEIKKQAFESAQLDTSSIQTAEKKEGVQFVEISSIQIEKTGVLENEKTKFYEEKMSSLNVAERALNLSTHIILKKEIKPSTGWQLDF